jgi:hypothetical protein
VNTDHRLQVHPDAIRAFDQQANALPGLIREFTTESAVGNAPASEVHVSGSFGPNDIIGEIRESIVDYRGKAVLRFFRIDGKKYGLPREGYALLLKLVSAIKRVPTVGDYLSGKHIEEKLFDWIHKRFAGGNAGDSFSSFLLEAASAEIREFDLWVPVANLQVTAPFQFGLVEVRLISKTMIDDWEQSFLARYKGDPANARDYFLRLRKKFQGYAAVCTSVVAEQERAVERALENAERATLYLAAFSVGTLAPDIRCVSVIKGSEIIRQASVIHMTSDAPPGLISRVLDHAEALPWLLDAETLSRLRTVGFEELSALLCLVRPNDFQQAILNALALYGKAAFAIDPIDKLVYVLASLESLLLKNQSEPIQQNLAERMAFFVSQEGSERKKIIEQVRFAYGLRSNYLHHGETEGEFGKIKDFLLTAWLFYSQVLVNWEKFKERIQFVNTIDDVKIGLYDGSRNINEG